jgi:hypothetical protein
MIITIGLAVAGGCKTDPPAPTVDDAKQVWLNINKHLSVGNFVELVEIRKTDGQMADVNGVKVYTLFYEIRERHLLPLGNWKPGDIETVKSNYGFQRTENGWQGPDGQHFKD